jgi:hypothetical protein
LLRESRSSRYSRRKILTPDEFSGLSIRRRVALCRPLCVRCNSSNNLNRTSFQSLCRNRGRHCWLSEHRRARHPIRQVGPAILRDQRGLKKRCPDLLPWRSGPVRARWRVGRRRTRATLFVGLTHHRARGFNVDAAKCGIRLPSRTVQPCEPV